MHRLKVACEDAQHHPKLLVIFLQNKEDISVCGNHRGNKVPSHTQIREIILINRLIKHVAISENKLGFTPSKSTTDAIQAAQIIVEKHPQTNQTAKVYTLFLWT